MAIKNLQRSRVAIEADVSYREFVERKHRRAETRGIDVSLDALSGQLFDWQRRIVQWALGRGRAALFEECGLGKTAQQLEWAKHVAAHTGERVLICAPLAVAEQTIREGQKFGVPCVYIRSTDELTADAPAVVITNYDRVAACDPTAFVGVVLDECFAPTTEVDVFNIDGRPSRKYIKDIRAGENIANANGIDLVADVHRREVSYAVKVTVGSQRITCSPNHPFFTQRGWVGAQDLRPGDAVMATAEAVRLVRRDDRAKDDSGSAEAILQSILLSEMADAPAGDPCGGAFAGGRGEAWPKEGGVVAVWGTSGEARTRAYPSVESDQRSACATEDLPHIESDAPRTFRAWGEWPWLNRAAADAAGCAWRELVGGVQFVSGPTGSWVSDALQDRHRRAQSESRYRGGWVLPCSDDTSRAGCEEGREAAFARVDRLEILQPGHPELEQWRGADGRIYFYDLGATRHPSYSVGGLLVHNSSILKNFVGKTKKLLLAHFAATPYRLCCTATPAPNDHMELGNHAEFLGLMPSNEMLMRWFINDSMNFGSYRLKKHAEADFWRWVASWAVCASRPSDVLGDDAGFDLAPLDTRIVTVDADYQTAGDQLFQTRQISATSMWRERASNLPARIAQVQRIVAAEPDEAWLLWCDTNEEADALREAILDVVEVRGSDRPEVKAARLLAFANGEIRRLISKSEIAGFGMNFQACARQVFVGVTFSFERTYQALRRSWRFGQTRPVRAYFIHADGEAAVLHALREKEAAHAHMQAQMARAMRASGLLQRERVALAGLTDGVVEVPTWLVSKSA